MLAAFADLMREVEVLRAGTPDPYGGPVSTPTVVARLPMSIQANRRRQAQDTAGTVLGVAVYLAYCAPHPEVMRPGFTLRLDGSTYEPETDALDIGGQGEVLVIPLKAPQGRQA